MVAPEQLAMNISITLEVPFRKVSLAAIEETVRKSLQETGRLIIKAILEALQERFLFVLQTLSPGRFVKNGRHGRWRTFNTVFGKIQVVNRQVRDKETGKSLNRPGFFGGLFL